MEVLFYIGIGLGSTVIALIGLAVYERIVYGPADRSNPPGTLDWQDEEHDERMKQMNINESNRRWNNIKAEEDRMIRKYGDD